MIKVFDSKDITLEICQEIRKLAKEAKACKASYVPFVRALRKKDLEECVAIINGEYYWLSENNILPFSFKRNRLSVKYFENDQKFEECTYENGLLHGKYEQWHENGQKCVECTYVDGKFHGKYNRWYDNGQKDVECNYVNGMLHGKYESWFKNGQKPVECTYDEDGKHQGKYDLWYEDGKKFNYQS